MKSLRTLALAIMFFLAASIFTTSAFAENPPNTYSVITIENGLKIETIYNTVDGGVVQVIIRNYD
jgi:hypothetical protein